MTRNPDNEPDRDPGDDTPEMPEPPDPARVRELRKQMNQERGTREADVDPIARSLGRPAARRAREIGAYTLIPMLMLAGPAVGYALGLLVQKHWGGEPWGAVVGLLVGLVAGFRQVFLVLANTQKKNKKSDRDEST